MMLKPPLGCTRGRPSVSPLSAPKLVLTFCLQTALLVFGDLSAAETDPASSSPEPSTQLVSHWKEIKDNMGGMQLDGLPKLSYPIEESNDLQQIGLRLELVHHVEVDAYGRPRSRWRLTGLRSSLSPGDRGTLIWRSLNGHAVEFAVESIGHRLTPAKGGVWHIRKTTPRDYEIRALDGHSWRYERGLLVRAVYPAFGELSFTTLGSQVRSIRRAEESLKEPLLEVNFSANARPASLRIGSNSANTYHWNNDGLLTSWERSSGGTVAFGHQDRILSEISELDRPPRHFTWGENPGYGRGDSRWRHPIHLQSDGEDRYKYTLSSRGYVIHRKQVSTGAESTTIFNPRRLRLEQRTGGEAFIVTFQRGSDGVTKLERIENGEGEILEEYLYDKSGQLVNIIRKGEPVRKLTYDATGRLMDIIEVELP